jgi:hypothetical protein
MGSCAEPIADGYWTYLRANLDRPRRFPDKKLGKDLGKELGKGLGMGLATWIAQRWKDSMAHSPRLSVLARVPLGPRHSVALLEADGTRLLVATSSDGVSTFFPLRKPEASGTAVADPDPCSGLSIETGSRKRIEPGLREISADSPSVPSRESRNEIGFQGAKTSSSSRRRRGLTGRISW